MATASCGKPLRGKVTLELTSYEMIWIPEMLSAKRKCLENGERILNYQVRKLAIFHWNLHILKTYCYKRTTNKQTNKQTDKQTYNKQTDNKEVHCLERNLDPNLSACLMRLTAPVFRSTVTGVVQFLGLGERVWKRSRNWKLDWPEQQEITWFSHTLMWLWVWPGQQLGHDTAGFKTQRCCFLFPVLFLFHFILRENIL